MNDAKNIRLLKWIRKYYPKNNELINKKIEIISTKLILYGFVLNEYMIEGGKTPINSINFERKLSELTEFIMIIFDKRNPLRFQVLIGAKLSLSPYRWEKAACLARKRSENMNHRWLGASLFSISKERKFCFYFEKFVESIEDIDEFLSSGKERGLVFALSIGK